MQYIVGVSKVQPTKLVTANLKTTFPSNKKKGTAMNAVTSIVNKAVKNRCILKSVLKKTLSFKGVGLNLLPKYIATIKVGIVIGRTKVLEKIFARNSDTPTSPTTNNQNAKFQALSLFSLAWKKPILDFFGFSHIAPCSLVTTEVPTDRFCCSVVVSDVLWRLAQKLAKSSIGSNNLWFQIYSIIISKLYNKTKQIKHIVLCFFLTLSVNEAFASLDKHYSFQHLKSLIVQEEIKHGIPSGLLMAVASVESNMKPFALNINGKAVFVNSSKEAELLVKEILNSGVNNIDIGVMQINYRWHQKYFSDVRQMLIPEENIKYAAKLLSSLKKQHGTWNKAVKYYHSQNFVHNQKYTKKVVAQWMRYV